jgi:stage II sporulation protein D
MEVFTGGGTYKVEKDQIRWALGRPSTPGAILPSTKFTYEKNVTSDGLWSMVISGYGNGHGVGACQCGIIGRARDGQKYDKILKKYYEGVTLVRLY